MYKFLVWLFCLTLFNLSMFGQDSNSRESDEKALRYLKEIEWPKAYREQDTALLDRILSDEFQMIGSDGEWSNKKEQLKYIASHKPTYESFRLKFIDLKFLKIIPPLYRGKERLAGRTETEHTTWYT